MTFMPLFWASVHNSEKMKESYKGNNVNNPYIKYPKPGLAVDTIAY